MNGDMAVSIRSICRKIPLIGSEKSGFYRRTDARAMALPHKTEIKKFFRIRQTHS